MLNFHMDIPKARKMTWPWISGTSVWMSEIGKSALWKPTSRTWTQRTKQFGGRACRDWLHHIRNLMQELLDLSCYELYSQVCVRERQKHTLKITAYQLWSPSKNHWVAWPFLDLVIICEKWMAMKRYSYESKAVVQRDRLLRNWEYICLNTDLSFLFFIDMACGSHWAALLLLCWYLQCCRATCHWRSKWKIGKKENTRANLRQVNQPFKSQSVLRSVVFEFLYFALFFDCSSLF